MNTQTPASGSAAEHGIEPEFTLNSDDEIELLEALDALRDRGAPVQPIRYNGEIAHIVLGYDAVGEAFANTRDLPSSTFYELFTRPFFGFVVSTAPEGEEHRFHRMQLLPSFAPGAIRAKTEEILEPLANELIDVFPVGQPFDFIAAYAEPLTFNVISALLGIPRQGWDGFRSSVRGLLNLTRPEEALAAKEEVISYLRELIEERKTQPGDDLISALIAAQTDGRRFTDEELVDAVRFLYPAAQHNTLNALGLCMGAVLSQPEILERVKQSEKDRYAAVDETLRLFPPIALLPRYADRPIRLHGVDIPANSFVLLAISSANRDPAHYGEPTTFSLDRRKADHLAFGRGVRFCLGVHLARVEMELMLRLMLSRLPGLRLVGDLGGCHLGSTFCGYKQLLVEFDERLAGVP